jgi:hypothetical protein
MRSPSICRRCSTWSRDGRSSGSGSRSPSCTGISPISPSPAATTVRRRDGNREDTTSVEPALARLDSLRAALPQGDPPLLVGDSKLLSAGNLRAFETRELRFVCPHRKDAPMKRRLAAVDEETLLPLAYRRERHKQCEPRYLAREDELTVASVTLRALYVLSLYDQEAARAQRQRQLGRAEEEIGKLNGGVPESAAPCRRWSGGRKRSSSGGGSRASSAWRWSSKAGTPQAQIGRD